jgi:GNAT superfamily N-acetyltransferase
MPDYSEIHTTTVVKAAQPLLILMAQAWLDMVKSGYCDGVIFQWQQTIMWIEYKGAPVAMLSITFTEHNSRSSIQCGYCAPRHRRKGLYTRLYQAAREWAIAKGACTIEGVMDTSNTVSIETAKRLGRHAIYVSYGEDLPASPVKVDTVEPTPDA